MGLFNDALDTVTQALDTALGNDIEVRDHPGRFTDDEFGKILLKPRSVRVAIEQIPDVEVEGDGVRKATVRFVAFILCADTRGEDRHKAALEIVEQITGIVVYNRWGKPEQFRSVAPDTITAENLYSGEIDNGKGLAWWAVSWTQAIQRR